MARSTWRAPARHPGAAEPPGAGLGFVDADGDGICDYLGTGQGLSANFVDADGDGVCDNLQAAE